MKNNEGVNPVIATLLLVAITVVLAAVLYCVFMKNYDPQWASDDYLGDGLFACPSCDWEGYPGEMIFHAGTGGFFSTPGDHYCPECGREIDVRG